MSKLLFNQNPSTDLSSINPDKIIEMSFNFDLLKYALSVLINNQQNMENEISNLKSSLFQQQEKSGNLELEIIELKLKKAKSPEELTELNNKKKILESKNKEIKTDLENYSKINEEKNSKKSLEIYNMKQPGYESKKNMYESELSSELSNKINQSENKIKDKDTNDKNEIKPVSKKQFPTEDLVSKTMLDNVNNSIEALNSDINSIKSTILNLQKELSDFRNNSKEIIKENMEKNISIVAEEAIQKKILEIKNGINNDISSIKDNMNSLSMESKEKISKLDEQMKKISISDDQFKSNKSVFDENYQKELDYIKSNLKKMEISLNQHSEKLSNVITPLTLGNSRRELEQKIDLEKKTLNIEILELKSALNSLKNQVLDHLNDSRDRNNISTIMRFIETMSENINRLLDFKKITEEKEKRKAISDNNKYIKPEQFNEGMINIKKIIENYRKEIIELRFDISAIREDELTTKASFKDLKSLEDVIIERMNKLKESIKDHFVEKNMLIKNLKYIELQTKNLIEENKKIEKQDNWLLAKKPFSHLCASCEAYIGDLKPTTNSNFISWNRYPQKNNSSIDNNLEKKIFKINAGFSKVLQMVSQDTNKEERVKSNSENKSKSDEKRNSSSAEKDKYNHTNIRKIPNLNASKKEKNLISSKSFIGIEEYDKIKSLPTIMVKNKNKFSGQNKYNTLKNSSNNISVLNRDEFYENMKDNEDLEQVYNEKPKITKIYKRRVDTQEKTNTENKD